MRPTELLQTLITSHMTVPGHVELECPKSNFVMSGLRAAGSANSLSRNKILSDISDVLNCNAKELEFLFDEFAMPIQSSPNYEVMVPDFQTRLMAIAE